ncbi:MAG: DUF3536 domain-containing protein [Planctomycetota bacterium]
MAHLNRHVCIHGHFYQPPRENPWLGAVERQPGAAPFHDWNERITAECYAASARARIHDAERRIDRLANNFLNISFNVGPTLFQWLADHHPHTIRRILAADRKSAERLDGHGNAIAQVYSHLIMPLASARDRHTQVVWGLADFAHHFGRPSEGMWLSECAVNTATVRTLIDHGVRFIILAPDQAARVRPLSENAWRERGKTPLDTRRAYRLFDRTSSGRKLFHRHLDVFFYDGALSHAIAFQHLLRDAEKMAARFEAAFSPEEKGHELVSAASDGESYGHHEPYGEMCLAYFYEALIKGHGESVVNYAHFLAKNPPACEAELYEGEKGEGSSWSCAHGVDRWYRACGCTTGGEDWWKQDWRAPLRETLDALRRRLDAIFEREGSGLFHDPWEARDAYISVLLDRSPENRARFLDAHAPGARKDLAREGAAWRLLEMQKNAMLMYTSCGWFFAEISGVEPVQNMRYALRAAEHARAAAGEDLLPLLLEGLEKARSNRGEYETGAGVLKKLVIPSVYPPEKVAACYAMMEMFGLERPPYAYGVALEETSRSRTKDRELFSGMLRLEDLSIHAETLFTFLVALFPDGSLSCFVEACEGADAARSWLKDRRALPKKALREAAERGSFSLKDLPEEPRALLFNRALDRPVAEVAETFARAYDDFKPHLGLFRKHEVAPPEALRVLSESVLASRFLAACRRMAEDGGWDPAAAEEAKAILKEAETYNLAVNRTGAAAAMAELVLSVMERLVEKPDLALVEEADALIRFSREAGFFFENGGKIENRYWLLLRRRVAPWARELRAGRLPEGFATREEAERWVGRIHDLGCDLNFSRTHLEHLLAYLDHAEPDEGET